MKTKKILTGIGMVMLLGKLRRAAQTCAATQGKQPHHIPAETTKEA